MTTVFVDTAAWLAALNSRDSYHAQAQALINELREQNTQLITSDFVLLEVADALAAPTIRQQTIQFINALRRMSFLTIVPVTNKLFKEAWTLYSQRLDKDWGLTDCTSFVIMNRHQITMAFTTDHHFVQDGFQKML